MNHVLGLLTDASSLPRPTTRVARLLHQWRGSGVTLVLSVFLLVDVLPLARHSVLRISTGGTIGSDNETSGAAQDADAIDFAQQCGDWGLFYLALLSLVMGVRELLARASGPEFFAVIKAPIAPVYDGDADGSDVAAAARNRHVPSPSSAPRTPPPAAEVVDGSQEASREPPDGISLHELSDVLVVSLMRQGMTAAGAAGVVEGQRFEIVE